jgi:hypothetical protein
MCKALREWMLGARKSDVNAMLTADLTVTWKLFTEGFSRACFGTLRA